MDFDHAVYRYEARAVGQRMLLYLRIAARHLTWTKLRNFIDTEIDYRLAREVCKGRPWSAKIEPTNLCNLDCTYCPRADAPYGLGRMPLDTFSRIIDEIKSHTFIVALHLWGEPLLHRQLPDMIRYAVDNGIGTYISSNFNLLTREQAAALIASRLDLLTVCVDGSDQASYEVFRKGGTLSKVLRNIELFLEVRAEMRSSKPFVELQFVVTPQTQDDVARVRALARELGVDSFKAKPVYPILVESKGEFVLPSGEQYYPIRRRSRRKTCWWLWRTITIGWDGSVLPCCRVMFSSAVGNVVTERLGEVWNNERYQQLRSTFRAGRAGARPCNICHVPYTSIHG